MLEEMLRAYFIQGILNYQFCSVSLVRKTNQVFVSVLFCYILTVKVVFSS